MKVIKKRPGYGPEVVDILDQPEAFRAELGGDVAVAQLFDELAVLHDPKGENENWLFSGAAFKGTILIVGVKDGKFQDVEPLDGALWALFRTVRYKRADRANNVWQCRRCGHLEKFEADGPYENGWNVCPKCSGFILRPCGGRKRK